MFLLLGLCVAVLPRVTYVSEVPPIFSTITTVVVAGTI